VHPASGVGRAGAEERLIHPMKTAAFFMDNRDYPWRAVAVKLCAAQRNNTLVDIWRSYRQRGSGALRVDVGWRADAWRARRYQRYP
jgi:hypothetical protein